jgi:hypothetical protein
MISWIYGSISTELFGIIMAPSSMARQIWDSIDNLFHDNKKCRDIALDAELHNTPQGDMTIHDYCAKLKSLADVLGTWARLCRTKPSSSRCFAASTTVCSPPPVPSLLVVVSYLLADPLGSKPRGEDRHQERGCLHSLGQRKQHPAASIRTRWWLW